MEIANGTCYSTQDIQDAFRSVYDYLVGRKDEVPLIALYLREPPSTLRVGYYQPSPPPPHRKDAPPKYVSMSDSYSTRGNRLGIVKRNALPQSPLHALAMTAEKEMYVPDVVAKQLLKAIFSTLGGSSVFRELERGERIWHYYSGFKLHYAMRVKRGEGKKAKRAIQISKLDALRKKLRAAESHQRRMERDLKDAKRQVAELENKIKEKAGDLGVNAWSYL